jgi:hypothetical protein
LGINPRVNGIEKDRYKMNHRENGYNSIPNGIWSQQNFFKKKIKDGKVSHWVLWKVADTFNKDRKAKSEVWLEGI